MTTSVAAHEPVSSRDETSGPGRFFSSAPSLGGDARRQQVDPAGFEAVAEFQLPQGAPPPPGGIRAASELTYGQPAEVAAAPFPPGAPAANRTPVPDTTLYPWRANAALLITVPGHAESFLASGWFIGPYAVITAAHAVYPREPGGYTGWASQIKIIAGLNGFPNPGPLGEVTSKLFYCPTGWQGSGDQRLDYGVVLLNQAIGLKTGTYGYATYAANDLQSSVANLAGYPVVSPDHSAPQGRQWYGASNVLNVDDSYVYYNLGTLPGDSGSCVYRNIGEQSYAMAVHTSTDGSINRGIRIIEPVYNNLRMWASMHG
jgi:V8-like Glu-specific endopeptidase